MILRDVKKLKGDKKGNTEIVGGENEFIHRHMLNSQCTQVCLTRRENLSNQ
jgi:hypothetical protein